MQLTLSTPEGLFVAHYSERGLCSLEFPSPNLHSSAAKEQRNTRTSAPAEVRRWHRQTERAVNAILAGRSVDEWPPLDFHSGTSFQQAVWRALQRIPAGRTLSYGDVARKVGRPGAARAVGAACGANPIPVLVPCHRVLASGGGLGGFTSGLEWKRKLLAREGVALG
jgi:O-6-methylguanine DNA methyltransferase